jgi:hypothetical protein
VQADQTINKQLQDHYAQIKRFRARAAKNAAYAQINPKGHISSAQDGTEQMGYGYPKPLIVTKEDDSYRLKTKVMISMVHGRALFYYVTPENIAGGPDGAIECIQRQLKSIDEREGGIPKTFYFQADNCSRESKNTYQIAYFAWLVERGVFDKVYLSFHPVGHTHNECDQCASRISLALRNRECL